MKRIALGLSLAALILAGCIEHHDRDVAPPAPGSWRVYVTNETSGDLTVIDGTTNEVIETIPLGKRPRGVRVSPDGRYLYIALSGSPVAGPGVDESTLPPADKSADGIGVMDLSTRKIVRILRGVSDPEQLAVLPNNRLLIASEDTGTALIVDANDGHTIATLMVGGEPEGVAVSPDGKFGYVTSEEDHLLSVIDIEAGTVVNQFEVGDRPRNAEFSRDGAFAYVTGEVGRTVTRVDAHSHAPLKTVTFPDEASRPMGVAISPDGKRVYITTGRSGGVMALDAETLEPVGQVQVGVRPWGLAISPDGKFLYTANGPDNDVTVVDAATLAVVTKVKAGAGPWGVAVDGMPKPAAPAAPAAAGHGAPATDSHAAPAGGH